MHFNVYNRETPQHIQYILSTHRAQPFIDTQFDALAPTVTDPREIKNHRKNLFVLLVTSKSIKTLMEIRHLNINKNELIHTSAFISTSQWSARPSHNLYRKFY